MANGDIIAFNVASFICALFVLEFGADKFVDNTAVVARRTGISPALIGLLTAGAEWEEVRSMAALIRFWILRMRSPHHSITTSDVTHNDSYISAALQRLTGYRRCCRTFGIFILKHLPVREIKIGSPNI